ncbi:MAG: hypothetical protein KZQ70_09170 [gamma proteobacterium symbiont of Lucinoma myriamae]|nr:hypothetical protein [gamma proteobacterium symbiont of Lucinoma myriamae]MCU7818930.1 hypothetical protein [gamma proteobacterium symbiont of Lucinoma myriamae]
MAKASKDFSEHFKQASKRAKELGYANLLDLDVRGTEEHKQIIQNVYKEPVILSN